MAAQAEEACKTQLCICCKTSIAETQLRGQLFGTQLFRMPRAHRTRGRGAARATHAAQPRTGGSGRRGGAWVRAGVEGRRECLLLWQPRQPPAGAGSGAAVVPRNACWSPAHAWGQHLGGWLKSGTQEGSAGEAPRAAHSRASSGHCPAATPTARFQRFQRLAPSRCGLLLRLGRQTQAGSTRPRRSAGGGNSTATSGPTDASNAPVTCLSEA